MILCKVFRLGWGPGGEEWGSTCARPLQILTHQPWTQMKKELYMCLKFAGINYHIGTEHHGIPINLLQYLFCCCYQIWPLHVYLIRKPQKMKNKVWHVAILPHWSKTDKVPVCQKTCTNQHEHVKYMLTCAKSHTSSRQACSSHCNLDSRIGRRQCCLTSSHKQ